jgi:hypothetical protein
MCSTTRYIKSLSLGVLMLMVTGCQQNAPPQVQSPRAPLAQRADPAPSAAAAPAPSEAAGPAPSAAADGTTWIRSMSGASPPAWTVPASFCTEDPRYCALVPSRPVRALAESWSSAMGPLEHKYEVSVGSREPSDMVSIGDGLRALGRTVAPPLPNGTITAVGEPHVLAIPVGLLGTVRVVFTFGRIESRASFVAFAGALPELSGIRESLQLQADPETAQFEAHAGDGDRGSSWSATASWPIDRASEARLSSSLAGLAYTHEQDGGWTRTSGDRRIEVHLEGAVSVKVSHEAGR